MGELEPFRQRPSVIFHAIKHPKQVYKGVVHSLAATSSAVCTFGVTKRFKECIPIQAELEREICS